MGWLEGATAEHLPAKPGSVPDPMRENVTLHYNEPMRNLLKDGTKCLLVQTVFSEFSFWNYREVCNIVGAHYPAAPLGLMTVAALLPQSWDFRLIDENVEPLEDDQILWADLVCTGGMLPQQKNVLALVDRAHALGRPVAVGGPDPTSQPKVYDRADYLVLGEGEVTIPLFLEGLARDEERGVYASDTKADMSRSVVPRYDLIRFKDYLMLSMQFVRGCPFGCEFCDIVELYGKKPRYKENDQILAELQRLYDLGHRGHIDFVDDNFIGNKNRAKALLRDVGRWSQDHGHPFYFTTEASIDLAEDDELLGLMRDVDFRYVFIGVETPETDALRATRKSQNVGKSVTDAVRKLLSYGIISNGGFIMGFDGESDSVAGSMARCIQESGICMAMVGLLYALPNTQLTRRLREEGRLFSEGSDVVEGHEIDQSTGGLNFRTLRPRARILRDFIDVLEEIYHPESYFRRVVYNGLNLNPGYRPRPDMLTTLKNLRSFLRVSARLGFNGATGTLYWNMLFTVLWKNPRAVEAAVNLAAMYIHLRPQKDFAVGGLRRSLEADSMM
jgi:radical SAM superfamily enzyme YgiQ (UPF0313 family)